MKTIVVDDEMWMLIQFEDECTRIPEIELLDTFDSPLDALQFVKKEDVDVVFLDVNMPEMTGPELATQIAEIKPEVTIVFLTADDSYLHREQREVKERFYVTKPYYTGDIIKVIEKIKQQKEGVISEDHSGR